MKNLYFLFFLLMLTGIFSEKGNAREEYFFTDQNPALSIIVDKKDVSSAEAKDGYIKIEVSGGQAPYSFHCFSPYSTPESSIGETLTLKNIKAGVYLFVIQDKSGNTESREVKIEVR